MNRIARIALTAAAVQFGGELQMAPGRAESCTTGSRHLKS